MWLFRRAFSHLRKAGNPNKKKTKHIIHIFKIVNFILKRGINDKMTAKIENELKIAAKGSEEISSETEKNGQIKMRLSIKTSKKYCSQSAYGIDECFCWKSSFIHCS